MYITGIYFEKELGTRQFFSIFTVTTLHWVMASSVVNLNTSNLGPDPGFWPNLDPDPG